MRLLICRKLLGEGLGSCTIEEIVQIEQQLERSVGTIRAKKVLFIIKLIHKLSIWFYI